jgi:hypothetical protein
MEVELRVTHCLETGLKDGADGSINISQNTVDSTSTSEFSVHIVNGKLHLEFEINSPD